MWSNFVFNKAENFSHKQLVLVATPVSTGVYFLPFPVVILIVFQAAH